jgi:hypothetical protein
MADLPDFPMAAGSRPLPANRLRTARRFAEQGYGDIVYERPLIGAAVAASLPLAALALD